MEDAETVIVTMGGMTGAGMDAVDEARARGIKVGLVKIRFYRPFPAARIAAALRGKKAFCVVDRSVSFGWNCGSMYVETRSALFGAGEYASFSAIGGIGGPRCCDRSANVSMRMTVDAVRERLGVDMQWSDPVCTHHQGNNLCLGSACPFNPGRE